MLDRSYTTARPRLAGWLLAFAAALVLAGSAQAQPNVVLVLTDDQRWDTLAYMPTVSSELVGKGVTFPNAFVVNPLCCPSRASILTGLYSNRSGVWSNSGPHGGVGAFADQDNLATWLDDAGYETMLAGKWLHGYRREQGVPPPKPRGWDRWAAFVGSPGYFVYTLTDGEVERAYGTEGPREEEYSTDVLAEEAIAFVEQAEGPFLIYLAPFAPHQENKLPPPPAPRHEGAYEHDYDWSAPSLNEADVSDKPRFIRRRQPVSLESVLAMRQGQLESLLAVDDAVAGILAALADKGELENTLFVFTSDNGFLWGEHRVTTKRVAYEESIRVPLVVRWDALGVEPRVDDGLALNVDIAPTIMDAVGAPVPGRDGLSLLPLIRDGDASAWRGRFLLEYHDPPFFPSYCGIRTKRWKYVQLRTGEEEIYDLSRDPYELENERPRRLGKAMVFRAQIVRSRCRPPGFRPLRPCTIKGTRRGDDLRGTRRPDWVCAGRGNDRIDVRGGGRDTVTCGPGRDTVYAGPRDRVADDCERVLRRSPARLTPTRM